MMLHTEDKSNSTCTCVSHSLSSCSLFLHSNSPGLSVQINVNKSVLCGSQEGPPVGDLPLMLAPAVAFRLLIHGSPFSGNDSNAKVLA